MEMGDREMPDQDLLNGSDVSLADASVEQQETAKLLENQKSGEKKSYEMEGGEDKTVTLSSDVNLTENQVLSNEPGDSKVTSADGEESGDDKTVTLSSEVKLLDNQVLSNEPDNSKVTSSEGNLSAENGDQMTENKTNEDGTHVENNHEADVSRDSMLIDNQVLSQEPDNNEATADGNLSANNGDQMTENKSNGDGTHVENNREADAASARLPNMEISTPKVKDENVRKFKTWLNEDEMGEAGETGTPEEVATFMKELESFHRVNALDYKPPKFYGEPLNCLKLWRAVIRLGGYELVTATKLWRQVGESFHPPKTCTTVSWTFRIFYEKALLEFEKHMRQNGELPAPAAAAPFTPHGTVEKDTTGHQATGSGRQRRDAAARAMQGWHSQRTHGNGDVGEPIIKDKSANSSGRREKHLKSIGLPKYKTSNNVDFMDIPGGMQAHKQLIPEVVDIGPPADWVKINVRESKDCFEVYALVPGLLREEVRVQSDPAGRLVITGQPEQVINPWGITPFKKVVNLPGRIDPLRTSALVSLHGRLFVRVPFERESA